MGLSKAEALRERIHHRKEEIMFWKRKWQQVQLGTLDMPADKLQGYIDAASQELHKYRELLKRLEAQEENIP